MSFEPRVRFKTPFRELAELIANTFRDHGFSYVIEPESDVELSYEVLIKKGDEKIASISISLFDEDYIPPYALVNILINIETKDLEIKEKIKKILTEAKNRISVKRKLETIADELVPELKYMLNDVLSSNENYNKPVIKRRIKNIRKVINEMKEMIDKVLLILGDEEIEES